MEIYTESFEAYRGKNEIIKYSFFYSMYSSDIQRNHRKNELWVYRSVGWQEIVKILQRKY